jgi:hypothetical protein
MMAMTGDGRQEAEALADQVREYNTYAGSYIFDGKRLITRVDSCSNHAYMGKVPEVSHEGRAHGATAACARIRGPWMGATHFKMRTLKHVGTEMALQYAPTTSSASSRSSVCRS